MKPGEIRIGMRVKVNMKGSQINGKCGTIIKDNGQSIGIAFDEYRAYRHNCDGLAKSGHGWFVHIDYIFELPSGIQEYVEHAIQSTYKGF